MFDLSSLMDCLRRQGSCSHIDFPSPCFAQQMSDMQHHSLKSAGYGPGWLQPQDALLLQRLAAIATCGICQQKNRHCALTIQQSDIPFFMQEKEASLLDCSTQVMVASGPSRCGTDMTTTKLVVQA